MACCSIASNEAKCESTAIPNWVELPREITANILERLSTIEIVTSVRYVCPRWWNVFKDPLMWRIIRMTDVDDFPYDITDEQSMEICRYAIKQSCGHLKIICIEGFGTDDLLKFIAENASNLRYLGLVLCPEISNEGFCQAVKKLPVLEELDISRCNLSKDSLDVVGQYCPLLTFLNFVRWDFSYNARDIDDEAFVIANTMFGLRHLNIQGHKLSNAGLLAILAGCHHLEFLDIRRCYNLKLDESLKKKCMDQIKHLLLPEQSVSMFIEDWDEDHVTYCDSIIDDDCYDPYD